MNKQSPLSLWERPAKRDSARRVRAWPLQASLAALTFVLLACAPGAPSATEQQAGSAKPAAEKTLSFGIQAEPDYLVMYGRVTGQTFTAMRYFLWHGNLTEYDFQNNPIASAAVKVPSLADGDWKVNPDGTMQVTWQIRPDAYWHDGTPLTAADFAFGWEVISNPQLIVADDLGLNLVKESLAGVQVIDDRSFVVNWKHTSFYGNANNRDWVPAIPRHKLEADFRAMDPVAFMSSPAWREDLLGIGPYKLVQWDRGQGVQSVANDQYFLGRPKIDRVTVKWVPDNNVLIAQMLAGAVDIAPAESMIKPDQLAELRRQWGPNKGLTYTNLVIIRQLSMNFREGGPWTRDVRFRQAMMMSINRQELADILQLGMTRAVPWFIMPDDPITPLVERAGIPRYDYNPTLAARLFAETGWTKGADGLLRTSAGETTGKVYCCRYPSADSNDVKESQGWGQGLKEAGLDVEHPVPEVAAALAGADRRKAQQFNYGAKISNWFFNSREHFANLLSSSIPTEENRWIGPNTSTYSNPAYDRLFDQRVKTLAVSERQQVEVQMVKLIAEELPVLPVYYNPLGVAVREGIRGPAPAPVLNMATAWDIHKWDMD